MLYRKAKIIGYSATLLIIIAGIVLIQHKKNALNKIPPVKTYAVVVSTAKTQLTDTHITLPYLAEVQSDTDVNIASKVTARILSIVPAGTRVKKDDLLVSIDASDLKARESGLRLKISEVNNQIKAKKSELQNLVRLHQHNKELLAIQAVSQDKYDTEASQIISLKATIEGMKNNAEALSQNIKELQDTLSYTRIKAPFDGVVSKTFVSRGGIANSGKILLSLAGGTEKRFVTRVAQQIKPLELIYQNERCDLHSLHSTLNGLNEYSCPTRTNLPTGSRQKVRLTVYKGPGILIPVDGLLNINQQHLLFAVEGDKTMAKPVSVIADGTEGYVIKGVDSGVEYVLAKPDIMLKLLSGARIVRSDIKE